MKQIKHIKVSQFGPFSELDLRFASGINVVIGSNGSGKSQLLKLLYTVAKTHETAVPQKGPTGIGPRLAQKLVGVFRPADDGLGRVVQRKLGRGSARVDLTGDNNETITFKVTTPGNLHVESDSITSVDSAVFIPSREALSMYEGFIQAYQNRELSFDETYYDLCVALSGAALRGPRLDRARALVEPLEEVIGGRVVLTGTRFIVQSSEGTIEAHLLAEGWRKLAGIAHLVLNGTVGKNAFLFWDEPEANLNPRLIVLVRRTLVELARAGVQVFVASHDYLLTNELNFLAEQDNTDVAMRFISLERNVEGQISVEQTDTLSEIQNNSILDEFVAHYERERSMVEETANSVSASPASAEPGCSSEEVEEPDIVVSREKSRV